MNTTCCSGKAQTEKPRACKRTLVLFLPDRKALWDCSVLVRLGSSVWCQLVMLGYISFSASVCLQCPGASACALLAPPLLWLNLSAGEGSHCKHYALISEDGALASLGWNGVLGRQVLVSYCSSSFKFEFWPPWWDPVPSRNTLPVMAHKASNCVLKSPPP